jgi:TRAP-type C4-dicarboxylate transport system substrate-binding protein
MAKQKIKWLLFHEPVDLFIRTAKDFQTHLDELTDSKYDIDILTLSEYQDKYLDGMICDPFTELKEGRVQMSRIYADTFGHANDFYALSMPYLFANHDHAARGV